MSNSRLPRSSGKEMFLFFFVFRFFSRRFFRLAWNSRDSPAPYSCVLGLKSVRHHHQARKVFVSYLRITFHHSPLLLTSLVLVKINKWLLGVCCAVVFAFVILYLTLDVVVVFELVSPGSKGCRASQSSLILVCVDYFEKGKNPFLGHLRSLFVFCQVSFLCSLSVVSPHLSMLQCGVCTDFIMF